MLARLTALLVLGSASLAWSEQDVTHYASGWSIALAEAACGDDEGCLTELANCQPGTDGQCSAQAAVCTDAQDTVLMRETLCTVRMEGQRIILRLPNGETTKINATRADVINAIGQGKEVCLRRGDQDLCFVTLVTDATFDWRKLGGEK